jgi:hypothetical protein
LDLAFFAAPPPEATSAAAPNRAALPHSVSASRAYSAGDSDFFVDFLGLAARFLLAVLVAFEPPAFLVFLAFAATVFSDSGRADLSTLG